MGKKGLYRYYKVLEMKYNLVALTFFKLFSVSVNASH